MRKNAMAKLIESMVVTLMAKTGMDADSARAFLGATLKTQQAELIKASMPTGSQVNLPRVGPAGVVGVTPEANGEVLVNA